MNCIHSILTKNTIKDGWLSSFSVEGGSMLDSTEHKLSVLSEFLFPDLPPQQRLCFVSSAIYGRKITASSLGLAPNTVKRHVQLAMSRLRDLNPDYEPYDLFVDRMLLFVSYYQTSIDKLHD